jgi:hypothetical protein
MADPDPSLPPVVPKSRSGVPVVVGILAIAAGAAAFLLTRGKGQEAPAPAASAKPAATTPAMVVKDAPPPPPPPPAEEEPASAQKAAPPATGAKKSGEAPKAAAEDQGPCGSGCKSGQDTPELQSALRARAGQARSCYERALSNNSGLTGKLVVAARISPQGTACRASVTEDSLGDPGVTRCVLQRFQSGTYPKPAGNGCLDVAVPINFVPRQ